MIGLGTCINVAGIVAGGIIGLLFGKVMEERYQSTLMKATGVCVLFIGISGGEWLNIELRMEQFGNWLKAKTGNDRDAGFVEGFVTASLTVCIGAMAVVGAIQDGVYGDYSVLAAKAVLDLIIIIIMTASMGKGCIFSAIPVALFQGSITILSTFLEPLMTEAALSNLSLTGSILIFCVGVNLIWEKKLRVANMLPALLVAVAWAFF